MIREELVPWNQLRTEADRGRLFAVLDACDAPWVPGFAQGMGEDAAVSLYRGEPEESHWAVAPYLSTVDDAVLVWITRFARSDDEGWGIFVLADHSLTELRRHLRRFLRVVGPGEERLYFRFYDPRVLPSYLASCTHDEAAEFFGPVAAFGITDPFSPEVCLLLRAPDASPSSGERPRIRINRR